jgi:hypothetical protein
LVAVSFPIRANLEYGQFSILYTVLFFLSSVLAFGKWNSKIWDIFSGIGFILCLDYKPHIFFLAFFALLMSRLTIKLAAILTLALGAIISQALTESFPFSEWISSLMRRGVSSSDLMGISPILHQLNINNLFILFIMSIITAALLWNLYLVKDAPLGIIVGLIGFNVLVLLPFLHPQDLVGVVFINLLCMIILGQKTGVYVLWMLLGLMLVWSNNSLINICIVLFTYVIARQQISRACVPIPLKLVWFLVYPLLVFHVLLAFDASENVLRHLFNFTYLIGSVFIVTRVARLSVVVKSQNFKKFRI